MDNSTQNPPSLERALGSLEGKMDMMVSAMNGLAASFDSLEKGRLSRLEIAFATLKAETTTEAALQSRRVAVFTSAAVSIIVAIVAAVIISHLHIPEVVQ